MRRDTLKKTNMVYKYDLDKNKEQEYIKGK